MNNTPILEARNLVKCYTKNNKALGVNLILPRGKIIGLLGPNGSGKSTFIKLVAGLLQPTSGSVTVGGYPIGPESKALVSYLPDRNTIPGHMTIFDALSYYAEMFPDFDRARAVEMLERLQLAPTLKFKSLSKGMKEKVQLVVAMSRRAQLYLLDEPIGGVDPATRDYILETIIKNHAPDSTVIISTHLIADVEPVLDEFVFIHRGQVMRYGSTAAVHEEEGTTLDALFREVFRC